MSKWTIDKAVLVLLQVIWQQNNRSGITRNCKKANETSIRSNFEELVCLLLIYLLEAGHVQMPYGRMEFGICNDGFTLLENVNMGKSSLVKGKSLLLLLTLLYCFLSILPKRCYKACLGKASKTHEFILKNAIQERKLCCSPLLL